MTTLLDRYKGALLGVLVGDALGAPYETWPSAEVTADMGRRGGLVPFDYPDPWNKDGIFPAGRPTDDSELTAALAESLLSRNGCDEEDQYQRFKRAVSGESFLWDGKAVGFGGTTRKVLAADSYEASLTLPDLPLVPSNGSVMRSAPLALYYHRDAEALDEAVRRSSFVTHRHPVAIEASLLFAGVLNEVLRGANPADSVGRACSLVIEEPDVDRLRWEAIERPDIPARFPHRGSAVLTVQAALWAFLTSGSFRAGITKTVALGGDTDTYAAVAGALLGARFGESGIPPEWLSAMKGADRMRDLAVKLYEAKG